LVQRRPQKCHPRCPFVGGQDLPGELECGCGASFGYEAEYSLHRADVGAHVDGERKGARHRFIFMSVLRQLLKFEVGFEKKDLLGVELREL
jgi:hypothetical protein